jgi:sulfite oxidase
VRSLITSPATGVAHRLGRGLAVSGHAWSGRGSVDVVATSIDFGQTWRPARLEEAPNRRAWQRWRADVPFPRAGYYEVWARATDSRGRAQPVIAPGWNPEGYVNNQCHRIAVTVT